MEQALEYRSERNIHDKSILHCADIVNTKPQISTTEHSQRHKNQHIEHLSQNCYIGRNAYATPLSGKSDGF